MNFVNIPPDWENQGEAPSEDLQQNGFLPGYKPPAAIFNWFWNKVSNCIKELQQKLSDAPIPLSGTCSTAKGATAKVVNCTDFKLYDGARIAVTFANGNSSNYMTLNVNGTGAYFAWFPIGSSRAYNNELISQFIVAGGAYEFVYQDGETPRWMYCGATSMPINDETPTYTEATERENLISGEKMSIVLGKIKKWFSDLKTVAFTGSYADLSNKPTSLKNPNALTVTLNGTSSTYDGSAAVSKSFYAPTSVGTAGYELVSNGSGAPVWKAPSYAVCSTAASTAAKTASISNFKLVTGATVRIKFTYAHTSATAATLNISSTGAKTIYTHSGTANVSVTSSHTWKAGEIVEFLYDGTYWIAVSSDNGFVQATKDILDNYVLYGDYIDGFDFLNCIQEVGNLEFEFGEFFNFTCTPAINGTDIATVDDVENKANIQKNPNATDGDIIDTHLTVGTRNTTVEIGKNSFAQGYSNKVSALEGFASGRFHNVTGNYGFAANYSNTVTGSCGFACGNQCSSGNSGMVGGTMNHALDYQTKFGRFASDGNAGDNSGTTGDAFTIGIGTITTRKNGFRVDYSGKCYAYNTMSSTGADYAEVWEWLDGNPNNEDRVGRFVAFEGTKIRLATANDPKEILGIISAMPAIAGDNFADEWHGMYLKDKFGRLLTEHKSYEAEYEEVIITDPETGEETTETRLVHPAYEADEFIINPDYDPEQEYIPRLERTEFDAVGTHGKLVVIDDGTCTVGGFCMSSENGIATASETGFYVMERIDETTIRVYVK